MDFLVKKDFKTPYIIATGQPHRPTEVKVKLFKKGQIVSGEIQKTNGKASYVLHKGSMVIPLSCIDKVVTQKITNQIEVSSAEGDTKQATSTGKITIDPKGKGIPVTTASSDEKKKKYLDAIIVGAVIGVVGVFYAEKKAWLPNVEQKNKIIGGLVGALAGAYLVYRFSNSTKK